MGRLGSGGGGVDREQEALKAAVRADYLTGVFSNRMLAAKHGVSEPTVRRWVKGLTKGETNPLVTERVTQALEEMKTTGGVEETQEGGEQPPASTRGRLTVVVDNSPPRLRDAPPDARASCDALGDAPGDAGAGETLDPQVEARRAMLRERIDMLLANAGDAAAIELAARAIVQVVREHRTDLIELKSITAKQRAMLDIIATEVLQAWTKAQELREGETVEERTKRLDRALEAMVAMLTAQAKALAQVSQAMQRSQVMERMAFGLSDFANPEPPAPPQEPERPTDAHFDKLRAKLQARLQAMTQPGGAT